MNVSDSQEGSQASPDSSSLERHGLQLKRLIKLLEKGSGSFGDALREAESFDWPALVAELRRSTDVHREQHDAALHARREELLRAARDANEPAERLAQADRVGIFQVNYAGAQVSVSLGGVRMEAIKETDGAKLFERLRKLRASLDREPFERAGFFKLLKSAYLTCRREAAGNDEFVPLRDLHREVVIESARQSEKFRRNPDTKILPSYSLAQFVFDLARFLRDGVACGGERLLTQTPSMREGKDTVFVPNLEHPSAAGTGVARLAIKAT